jgi:hypothetical protein
MITALAVTMKQVPATFDMSWVSVYVPDDERVPQAETV